MAYDDEWCVLCEEKMKETTIQMNGIDIGVCQECADLTLKS